MRRALLTVITTLFLGLVLGGFAVPASAGTTAPGDEVESMKIDYVVDRDGVLRVTETIEYSFGGAGRHGIYRDLVIREPYKDDDSKDQKYEVSKLDVSSPTGASAEFEEETFKYNADRDQTLRIKIGSANETVDDSETYVLKYEVRGSLRHFDDHSELYWDATGSGWDAILRQVTVTVEVPEGVQRAQCFVGKAGSTTQCAQEVSAGTAEYSASQVNLNEQVTVVAGIKPGVVSNDTPIVVDAPSALERAGISVPSLIGSALVTLAGIVAAVLYSNKGNKDQRYAGLPPGAFPPSGSSPQVVKDELNEDQIPVAFAPPPIPIAEGGLLIDAKANTTETAATLIDLAVRGGIRIDNTGEEQKAVLLDPAVATVPHEQVLLQHLFPGLRPGTALKLERRATGDMSMMQAQIEMTKALREQIKQRNWYLRLPRAGGGSSFASGARCACLAMVGLWVVGAGLAGTAIGAATGGLGRAAVIAIPVLAVLVAIGIWIGKRSKGQRNPVGRAVTDQLVGFRTYLATAEADQLRFEEGEDIFSKYLPWAIVFGLADRWQRVCAQLVAAGRLTPDPYWYTGPSYYASGYAAGSVTEAVSQTFTPPPTPSSGGGGGSSSGFSGGSSGGGGGGGGGGSW